MKLIIHLRPYQDFCILGHIPLPHLFVYGWPDYDCAVSNLEWEIGTARVLGLPVPSLAPYLGMVIGTSRLRVDAHGDNLARVETKGGYWRWRYGH